MHPRENGWPKSNVHSVATPMTQDTYVQRSDDLPDRGTKVATSSLLSCYYGTRRFLEMLGTMYDL